MLTKNSEISPQIAALQQKLEAGVLQALDICETTLANGLLALVGKGTP